MSNGILRDEVVFRTGRLLIYIYTCICIYTVKDCLVSNFRHIAICALAQEGGKGGGAVREDDKVA